MSTPGRNAKQSCSALPFVLVRVLDYGVLIAGASGSGKSDLALSLIDRGHCFVADEGVELHKVSSHDAAEASSSDNYLYGRVSAPGLGLLHVRGLGVLDVAALYGDKAVAHQSRVDLVIELSADAYAEAGEIDGDWRNVVLCGVLVPKLLLPITAGRDSALLVETAVRLHRMRRQGYRAEVELELRLQDALKRSVE